MAEIEANAVELLHRLSQERMWHRGLIESRLAGEYKKKLAAGGMSYSKACELLRLLGYEKKREEIWQPPKGT